MTLQHANPSIYLAAALAGLLSIAGCFPFPVTEHHGPKPGAIKAGKTTQADIRERFGPAESTVDGQFFLYRFNKKTEWWVFFFVLPFPPEGDPPLEEGRLLIEFDNNNVVKRRVVHWCEKKTAHRICDESLRNAMWMMIKELLGADLTAQYAVRVGSAAELLQQAVEHSDLDVISQLIKYGADVSHALHTAAGAGHTDVVELLITNGADVNAVTPDGRTPLHQAAQNGHTSAVELLLVHGAEVNAKDEYGATPMRVLARYLYLGDPDRRADIVKLLKRHGAKE